MLISVHIPKTGGVSFRNMLKEHYGPGFGLRYWEVTDAWGRVLPEAPATATCIHGHFVAHELSDRFPSVCLATGVRNPVERVVSPYYHRLRDPDPQNYVSRLLHEQHLGLLEFAELPEARNELAWFMGRKRPADFAFIGVTEHFEEARATFCQEFGLPVRPVRRDNCNAAPTSATYPLTWEVHARITALNEKNGAIYAECLDLFQARRSGSWQQRVA